MSPCVRCNIRVIPAACVHVWGRYAMDLYKALQDLYAEKEKLERAIASLEELQQMGGELAGFAEEPANAAAGNP